MDVVARPVAFRAPVLRPLLILLLIGLLVGGALALYAGSQRTRLPAPFGPATNGVVLATINGDIVAIDPATGARPRSSAVRPMTSRRGSRETDSSSCSFGMKAAGTPSGSQTLTARTSESSSPLRSGGPNGRPKGTGSS